MKAHLALSVGFSLALLCGQTLLADDASCTSCSADSVCNACQQGSACDQDGECGLGQCRGKCRVCGCCGKYCHASTCNMIPHFPYFPKDHGYHSYRPYNYIHVLEHQYQALTIGGDPRAPYANNQFAKIYEKVGGGKYEELDQAQMSVPRLDRIEQPLPQLEEVFAGEKK